MHDSTGCSGPGPVNSIHPCCKLLGWLFQSARAAGGPTSVPRVRRHRCVGNVMGFLLRIQQCMEGEHRWNLRWNGKRHYRRAKLQD